MIMGLGKGNTATLNGYFEITMPPNGTVIPVYGATGVTTSTVANGVIPMPAWQTLYYDLPLGAAHTSDPSRFKLVDYPQTLGFDIPATWVIIATRNGDLESVAAYLWGDGKNQDYWKNLTLVNSWVALGLSWPIPAWRINGDGKVQLRGIMASGNAGVGFPFCVLSSLGPDGSSSTGKLFNVPAGTGFARLDVYSNGACTVVSYSGGGSNQFVSLDNVSWNPAGS